MLTNKRKLRVAVDMHSLAMHPTGIGNYIKKLCSELFLSNDFTWFAYHPKEILEQSINQLMKNENNKFKEHGIEIPFPQQDVYIKDDQRNKTD